jgi:HTH-type transcriptional repressor of NAD biosynthesis genes
MTTALIIGKFYPPHNGHHYLIDTALEEMDRVIVLVNYSACESIHGQDRMRWVAERHRKADVRLVRDEHPIEFTDDGWNAHLDVWIEALDRDVPTHVYTAEDYGDEFARRLGERLNTAVEHRQLDVTRARFDTSASAIRKDPASNWQWLARPTRAGLTRRIVICGAESSGTTTLARDLAKAFKTAWVPEYGRILTEALEGSDYFTWDTEVFEHIQREQNALEERYARSAGPVLICDTDPYATSMFHELYVGGESPVRWTPAKALYIITDDQGVEFEQDGSRRFEARRRWQTEWFERRLTKEGRPWVKVTGGREDRVAQATVPILFHMKWNLADPIEYGGLPA